MELTHEQRVFIQKNKNKKQNKQKIDFLKITDHCHFCVVNNFSFIDQNFYKTRELL